MKKSPEEVCTTPGLYITNGGLCVQEIILGLLSDKNVGCYHQ